MPRIFGEILTTPAQTGVLAGTNFSKRIDLAKALVHPPTQAGISYSTTAGADSVVLSGGYVDDADYGDIIIYTGMGGRDKKWNHIADQQLTGGNLALKISFDLGLPVRVTRGWEHKSPYSPQTGYKYAGLYYVDDYWSEKSTSSAFTVWRFRLVSAALYQIVPAGQNQPVVPPVVPPMGPVVPMPGGINPGPAARAYVMIQRIIRDTKIAKTVKRLHAHKCQVCGITIETPIGVYAEAAHIQPLGNPYNGPDLAENILCLCPNHHVMFDSGAFVIEDDLRITAKVGSFFGNASLSIVKGHTINTTYLQYHRAIFA